MNWISARIPIAAGLLAFGIAFFVSKSFAQQTSNIAAVKVANKVFETALSTRDITTMENVWLHENSVNNVDSRHTTFDIGWEATKKYFEEEFASSLVIASSIGDYQIHVNGKVAWVNGVENGLRMTKSGETQAFTNFIVTIFVNHEGRWLIVSRHVSATIGDDVPPLIEPGPG